MKPRPRTGVRDSDPLAARSVSVLELRRAGFHRSISLVEREMAEKVARVMRISSLAAFGRSERKYDR